jgi:hypothetical protein
MFWNGVALELSNVTSLNAHFRIHDVYIVCVIFYIHIHNIYVFVALSIPLIDIIIIPLNEYEENC